MARKLREAFLLQDQKTALLEALTSVAGRERIAAWMNLENQMTAGQQGPTKYMRKKIQKGQRTQSVYLLDESKGMYVAYHSLNISLYHPVPSAGKVYKELAKLEVQPQDRNVDLAANKASSGTAHFLKTGLKIEKRQ